MKLFAPFLLLLFCLRFFPPSGSCPPFLTSFTLTAINDSRNLSSASRRRRHRILDFFRSPPPFICIESLACALDPNQCRAELPLAQIKPHQRNSHCESVNTKNSRTGKLPKNNEFPFLTTPDPETRSSEFLSVSAEFLSRAVRVGSSAVLPLSRRVKCARASGGSASRVQRRNICIRSQAFCQRLPVGSLFIRRENTSSRR